jgi:monofunctional glycosyltransferase
MDFSGFGELTPDPRPRKADIMRPRPMAPFRIVASIAAGIIILNICWNFILPDVASLKNRNPQKTSFMKYREMQWADRGISRKASFNWVPLNRISPYVVKAVIIAEDDKFWQHEGFDFEAIRNAVEKDITEKKFILGASTISQQLAKNLYLTPLKNPIRKIKEAILTWRLEKTLTKRRILELYLNCVEWGDGTFGIEAASHRYFGKPAADLDAKESAMLAAVLPNPVRFNPLSKSRFVLKRTGLIYRLMVRRGVVIEENEKVLPQPKDSAMVQPDSIPRDTSLDSTLEWIPGPGDTD